MPSLRTTKNKYSLFSLHGIMLIRLIFGFYFKCSNSTTVCLLLKLYCVGCCGLGYLQILMSGIDYLQMNFAAFCYDSIPLIDITANVLISLITEQECVMKFSSQLGYNFASILQKKSHCLVTYFLLFLAIIVEFVIIGVLFEDYGFAILTAYFYRSISFYSSRLTIVYITENYQKTVLFLCKTLRNNFERISANATRKSEQVSNFIESYMQLSKNLDSTIKCLRLKVHFYSISIFSDIWRKLLCIGTEDRLGENSSF